MTQYLDRYVRYLETLSPETLDDLPAYVHPSVRFADPFNDVRGVEAMRRVFDDMFEAVGPVSLEVGHRAVNAGAAYIAWTFHARLGGKPWDFEGVSQIRFDDDGLVTSHVDHWDTGREFFARLPVVGWAVRGIRRRLRVA
ncbi:MAG: nuclear transport factor 2 family protein [Rhodospirillales bacterium]